MYRKNTGLNVPKTFECAQLKTNKHIKQCHQQRDAFGKYKYISYGVIGVAAYGGNHGFQVFL